jgi:hypothetical protein
MCFTRTCDMKRAMAKSLPLRRTLVAATASAEPV